MGNVKVKVLVNRLAVGSDGDNVTKYRKGDEFIITEQEAKRLGNSVNVIAKIPEPTSKK